METGPEQLVELLETCLRGDSSSLMPERPRPDSTAGSVDLSVLSSCEIEVFRQIGSGASPRVIAARLGVSPKTVEAHRAHIKSKLGIRTAAALNEIAQAWSLWGSSGVDYVI
jgi:DNA-binding NarL/FixJ family response regulator